MDATLEQKVSQTVLQQAEDIQIGSRTYKFYPPSTATLILASEAISLLPHLRLDEDRLVEDTLFAAKECRVLGDIVAILLLGAKNLTEKIAVPKTKEKRLLRGLIKITRTTEEEVVIDRKAELAKELLEDLSPRELNNLTAKLLQRMQLADFFGLTTFLTEINLLRQTKVEETTAFGQ